MLELEIKSGFDPREKFEGLQAVVINMKAIVARPCCFNGIWKKRSHDGLWPITLGLKEHGLCRQRQMFNARFRNYVLVICADTAVGDCLAYICH